jgi:hypothetical protein
MRHLYYIQIMLLMTAGAFAQSPVTADISSQRVTANEVFNITITANGSDVQEPDLQPVRDAGIQLGTPSQQSSTSIRNINGRTSVVQSRTWRYPASIAKEGSVTIPRISVMVDGKEYLTQPMTVTVTNKIDVGSRGQDPAAELTVDDLVFVRAITDKTVVYQGEPVVLRLRLYTLDQYYVNVESPRALPLPQTEGFYAGQQWQQNLSEQMNGRTYRIMEISQVLYPAMPGELTIAPWEWQGVVTWYDVRRRPQTAPRMFATNPVTITAMPLPSQPPHFSGAVGKFNMNVHLSENNLVQGKPVRLIVTISGDGNPNTIGAPVVPEIPWAHISEPETEIRQQENNTDTTKLFSYLITPLEAGEQVVPPVEFTFFAPMLKNYKTDRSNEIKVTVQPAKEGDSFVAIGGSAEEERHKIDVFDGDMLPIITDPEAIAVQLSKTNKHLGFFTLLSPMILAFMLAVIHIFLQQKRRLSFDRSYSRRYYAKSNCMKTLEETKKSDDPTQSLYRAIASFIGNMLDINEAGLTSAEIESLLRSRNTPEELISAASRMLKKCERARYAGDESDTETIEILCSDAQKLMEDLHEVLKEDK